MKEEFCKCYATLDMYEYQYLERLVYTVYGVRRWRKQCEEEWKKITEKAKTHSGL
jgi:hypothetical protein